MNKLEIEYNTIKDYTPRNRLLETFGSIIEWIPIWGYVILGFVVGLVI